LKGASNKPFIHKALTSKLVNVEISATTGGLELIKIDGQDKEAQILLENVNAKNVDTKAPGLINVD